jgi:PhzF family phenazine biosynthesis protein
VLPVKIEWTADSPTIALYHQAPVFGPICRNLEELAESLSTSADNISKDLPAQVVSTGAAHLVVPLRNRAAIDALRPRGDALLAVLRAAGGQGCYTFSLDPLSPTAHAYSRFFNPTAGIWEDPATGSAAAPLACYLRLHGVLSDLDIVVEQGHAMRRPSRLRISLVENTVALLGRCALSIEGNLFL